MIITVTRVDHGLYEVDPANEDGTRVVRNGNDVPWRKCRCTTGIVWDRVGELIARERGEPVTVIFHGRQGS